MLTINTLLCSDGLDELQASFLEAKQARVEESSLLQAEELMPRRTTANSDAAQEALAKLASTSRSSYFHGDVSPSAWLLSILHSSHRLVRSHIGSLESGFWRTRALNLKFQSQEAYRKVINLLIAFCNIHIVQSQTACCVSVPTMLLRLSSTERIYKSL